MKTDGECLCCIWTTFKSSVVFCSGQSRMTWIQAVRDVNDACFGKMLMRFVVVEWVMSCWPVSSSMLARMFTHVYACINTHPGTDSFKCSIRRQEKWHDVMTWHDKHTSERTQQKLFRHHITIDKLQFPDFTLNRRQEKGCRMWWRLGEVISMGNNTRWFHLGWLFTVR